jgi:hypothetical protein
MDDNKKKMFGKMVDAYRKQESNGNPIVLKNKRRESKDGSKVVTKTKTFDPETGKTTVEKVKTKNWAAANPQKVEGGLGLTKSKSKVKEFMDGKKIYQGRERTDKFSNENYSSVRTTSREKKGDLTSKKYSFTENEKFPSENWGTKKNPDMSPAYETTRTYNRDVEKSPSGVSKTITEKNSEGMDYILKTDKRKPYLKWEKTPATETTTNRFRFRKNKKG